MTNLKNPILIKDTTNNTLSAAGTGLSFQSSPAILTLSYVFYLLSQFQGYFQKLRVAPYDPICFMIGGVHNKSCPNKWEVKNLLHTISW